MNTTNSKNQNRLKKLEEKIDVDVNVLVLKQSDIEKMTGTELYELFKRELRQEPIKYIRDLDVIEYKKPATVRYSDLLEDDRSIHFSRFIEVYRRAKSKNNNLTIVKDIDTSELRESTKGFFDLLEDEKV